MRDLRNVSALARQPVQTGCQTAEIRSILHRGAADGAIRRGRGPGVGRLTADVRQWTKWSAGGPVLIEPFEADSFPVRIRRAPAASTQDLNF